MGKKKLFLLDAYALIFRAYYAFIKNPRINSKGENTSAILGFVNSFLEVLKSQNPNHIGVCFDVGRKNVRTSYYSEYKGTRDQTPEGIKTAVPYIMEILQALGVPILFKEGYEADDVIGTLVKKSEKLGFENYMMTSDKDFAQLVSENTVMYRPAVGGNKAEIWDIEKIQEKFGVEFPHQVVDYLAMMGDSVDNIPGLPGVGDKTAKKFLKEYGSLETLLENTDQLKGKQKEKIENAKDLGLLSKKLATILTDVPIDFEPEKLIISHPDWEKLSEIYRKLEFRRLEEQTKKVYHALGLYDLKEAENGPPNQNQNQNSVQTSLFDQLQVSSDEERTDFNTVSESKHYQFVDTRLSVALLVEKLLKQKQVCFDCETTSLDINLAELVGIAFSYEKGKAYYVSFPEDENETKHFLSILKPFFDSENITKIGHNLKYDLAVLRRYEYYAKPPFWDTMIAHYLINPDMRHSMDLLSANYLDYKPQSIQELIGKKGKNQKSFRSVALEEQTQYAGEDADVTFQLKTIFEPELGKLGQKKLFNTLEMPLMTVLLEMESNGIELDSDALSKISKELSDHLKGLEEKIFKLSNSNFNLNSPKQLGEVLFDQMKIVEKPKKTKSGQYATSEDILNKIVNKHEIISLILDYRQNQKLKSTYIDALPEKINIKTKRIHTQFMQTVAATGRLASSNPNLQNIPIRTENGQKIRKAFVAKDKNHVLVSADYSQIELRLIAVLSGDQSMINAFNNHQDIHATTASKVFKTPINEVDREQRSIAKTINFGIIYGVSAFGLSQQTSLSRGEAKEMIDSYYETYPTLKKFINQQIDFARENGYVETIMGRRRYLMDINSNNHLVRSHAERNAVNAPIQGSAADIIKLAMINISKALKEIKSEAKLLLQVHDELILEVPIQELETIKSLIKDRMENVYQTTVPLDVEVGFGNNWLEAH